MEVILSGSVNSSYPAVGSDVAWALTLHHTTPYYSSALFNGEENCGAAKAHRSFCRLPLQISRVIHVYMYVGVCMCAYVYRLA